MPICLPFPWWPFTRLQAQRVGLGIVSEHLRAFPRKELRAVAQEKGWLGLCLWFSRRIDQYIAVPVERRPESQIAHGPAVQRRVEKNAAHRADTVKP